MLIIAYHKDKLDEPFDARNCYVIAIKTRFKTSTVSVTSLRSLTIPTLYGSTNVKSSTSASRPSFIPNHLDKLKHIVVLMDMCISPENASVTLEPAVYDPELRLPWHSRAMHYCSDPEKEPARWCIHINGHSKLVYPVVEKLGPALFHPDIWRRVPVEEELLVESKVMQKEQLATFHNLLTFSD
ncbi:hypothetical protein ONZ45_g9351 [Pleurotus djamor]|nr:hypothetical protein ONZ45_g9351 [Pleurotus djamor]